MAYATKNGVSLSTLRRYIKSNKIRYRVEGGRYLLWDEEGTTRIVSTDADPATLQFQKLKTELQKAQEEIAELKTLIALYEEKLPSQRI